MPQSLEGVWIYHFDNRAFVAATHGPKTTLYGGRLIRISGEGDLIFRPIGADFGRIGTRICRGCFRGSGDFGFYFFEASSERIEVICITAKLGDFGAQSKQRVFVVGEVGRAGPIAMLPGMTVVQAIAMCGGFSEYANRKGTYILRIENGKSTLLHFNYKKAIRGDTAQNLELKDGDTIVVP